MNNFKNSRIMLEGIDFNKVLYFQPKNGKLNSSKLDSIVEWIEDPDENHYMTVDGVYTIGDYILAVVPHGSGGASAFKINFSKELSLKVGDVQGLI